MTDSPAHATGPLRRANGAAIMLIILLIIAPAIIYLAVQQ
ncbi:MAG: hypothetical protein ACI9JD_002697 [Rhodococcus sp. (in: high G+C Gram-positive bacteria)]|jgi:hypothetical protein